MTASLEQARRFHNLLKRMLHSESAESLVSYGRLQSFMEESGLHTDDFSIVSGDYAAHLNDLNDRLNQRATQLLFFVENADSTTIAKAKQAGVIEDRFPDLADISEASFGPNWEPKLAKFLGITQSRISRWKSLREEIPADVISKIADMGREEREASINIPVELTAMIGTRGKTPLVELPCRALLSRILEKEGMTGDEIREAAIGGAPEINRLIKDGWVFRVGSTDRIMPFKFKDEYLDDWIECQDIRRYKEGSAHYKLLEVLEDHMLSHEGEGLSSMEWDRLTKVNENSRGGVNSALSDFQRRRRGEGVVFFTGRYGVSTWFVRPDWREG